MIWRVLVFFDVLTVGRYVYLGHGEAAAWAAMGVLTAVLLPLSKAVSILSKMEKHLAEEKALLSKILKGYAK